MTAETAVGRRRLALAMLAAASLALSACAQVPTSSPANASAALSAEVRTTGIPAEVAIAAASTLVRMPPVPTADPTREVSTEASSARLCTSAIRRAPGLAGWSV